VTSREIGYEHAPLNHMLFNSAALADFRKEDVESYARRWFSLDDALRDDQQQEKASAFLRESESIKDLRSNPLMLALLCNLYRGRGYIPRNRPEVYDECATMLFETWDKHRGITTLLPFQEHLRPAMRHLALWIWKQT
jgi:predicted NACHT family NTPase